MDKTSIQRTEAIAPVLVLLKADKPNWKDISCSILEFIGLEALKDALIDRRQGWEKIASALITYLESDATYCRSMAIINALPGTLEQISQKSDYHVMSVSQTLYALRRGGFRIEVSASIGAYGAPIKTFEIS